MEETNPSPLFVNGLGKRRSFGRLKNLMQLFRNCGNLWLINVNKWNGEGCCKNKIITIFFEGISAMTYKKEKKNFDLDFVNIKD